MDHFGVRGDAVDWDTALQFRRSPVLFPMGSLGFFLHLLLTLALWLWSRLSLKFHEGKGSRCRGLKSLLLSCTDRWKIFGNSSFLQACILISLSFTMDHSFTYLMLYIFKLSFIMALTTVVAVCVILPPVALPWTSKNGRRNQIQEVSSERRVLSSRILKKFHSKCVFTQSLIEY